MGLGEAVRAGCDGENGPCRIGMLRGPLMQDFRSSKPLPAIVVVL